MEASDQSLNTGTVRPTKIFLWCVPRSISTAVLKCMSNVDGVEAWHEPYTMAYMSTTLWNPMFKPENVKLTDIRKRLLNPDPKIMEMAFNALPRGKLQDQKLFTFPWVKEQLDSCPSEGKNAVFVKDMAFAVKGRFEQLPKGFHHTFLIRDPVAVFQSWKRMVAADIYRIPDAESINITTDASFLEIHELFKDSYELYQYARDNADEKPVVIDTEDLLNHPDVILPKYFKATGLEFHEKYLTWDSSRKIVSEWRGCFETTAGGAIGTAYASAFDSSSFRPCASKTKVDVDKLSSDLQFCINESFPYYKKLYDERIRVE